jgi:hypothetical protein
VTINGNVSIAEINVELQNKIDKFLGGDALIAKQKP